MGSLMVAMDVYRCAADSPPRRPPLGVSRPVYNAFIRISEACRRQALRGSFRDHGSQGFIFDPDDPWSWPAVRARYPLRGIYRLLDAGGRGWTREAARRRQPCGAGTRIPGAGASVGQRAWLGDAHAPSRAPDRAGEQEAGAGQGEHAGEPCTSGTHQTQTLCDEPWAAAVRPPAMTDAATSRASGASRRGSAPPPAPATGSRTPSPARRTTAAPARAPPTRARRPAVTAATSRPRPSRPGRASGGGPRARSSRRARSWRAARAGRDVRV